MNGPRLRTLLIDDEVLGRLALRRVLASHEDVEIVGECGDAEEALRAIEALAPDLLFLDIQMPGMDGFDLLRGLSPDTLPLVVFETAYEQHALRAFDAGAVDYVLKPIDQTRFDQAMVRVKEHWLGPHADLQSARPPPDAPGETNTHVERISVRTGEHIRVIQAADIDWVHADGSYVHIHVGGESFLHRKTLRHLLASLDQSLFLRIHRSVAVNLDRVHEIHPLFQGNAEVVLHDGTRLSLSRRFRSNARRVLGV